MSRPTRRGRSSRARRRARSKWRKPMFVALGIVCLIMMVAGLRPYASYTDNWLEFDAESSVTRFLGFGLATGVLGPAVSEASQLGTLQIRFKPTLQEPDDNIFSILAQLDSPGSKDPIIIGQWHSSIIIINSRDYRNERDLPRVSANLKSHVGEPIDVLVTFAADGTRIDVDGRSVAEGAPFSFKQPLSRIIIGNARDGSQGWTGALSSFVVMPEADAQGADAYVFDQDHLPSVRNATHPADDLAVPEPGKFPTRHGLGGMRLDQLLEQNMTDVVINFLGFAPFGFLVAGLLRTNKRPIGRTVAVVLTGIAGFLTSLSIELSQMAIPGRSPHFHDLVLNTSGALLGSIGFILFATLAGWWHYRTRAKRTDAAVSTPD